MFYRCAWQEGEGLLSASMENAAIQVKKVNCCLVHTWRQED